MIGLLRRSGFTLSALAIAGVIGFGVIAVDQGRVRYVTVLGELTDTQLLAVRKQLAGFEGKRGDVGEVKARLEGNDWIHRADVSKSWPSGLVVSIVPEQVIAYWNDDGFINGEADVLVTDLLIGGDLPHLYGPQGTELEVMQRFQQLSRTLGEAGHRIEVLTLSGRGSWSFETEGNLEVLLGKEDIKRRLARFLKVSARLSEDGAIYDRVDARYPSGVAVNVSAYADDRLEVAKAVAETADKTTDDAGT